MSKSNPRRLWLSALLVAGAALALGPHRVAAQPAPSTAERSQAERDVPHLAEVLGVTPGMTVADVGAGQGAMSIAFAKWLGPNGKVIASEVSSSALGALRAAKAREKLDTLEIVESGDRLTNLPEGCCDAIFLRDVYHHLTRPEPFNRSLLASLRPGGRLAIIDFAPGQGSTPPTGLPADRIGHGITADIVEREMTAAGFTHVRTITDWPPGASRRDLFLVLFRRPES
jgi:ubiquinone/menaquinone biosynthesis C-methylase UbiE